MNKRLLQIVRKIFENHKSNKVLFLYTEYIKNFEHSLRKQPNLKMNRRFEETLNNRRYIQHKHIKRFSVLLVIREECILKPQWDSKAHLSK